MLTPEEQLENIESTLARTVRFLGKPQRYLTHESALENANNMRQAKHWALDSKNACARLRRQIKKG